MPKVGVNFMLYSKYPKEEKLADRKLNTCGWTRTRFSAFLKTKLDSIESANLVNKAARQMWTRYNHPSCLCPARGDGRPLETA